MGNESIEPYEEAMTVAELLKDYDWQSAIAIALNGNHKYYTDGWGDDTFCRDDVKVFVDNLAEVVYYSEGENDGPNWIVLFSLKTPTEKGHTHVFLDAGCDYTGWDCQAGGAYEYTTLEYFLGPLGSTPEHKQRFGIESTDGR